MNYYINLLHLIADIPIIILLIFILVKLIKHDKGANKSMSEASEVIGEIRGKVTTILSNAASEKQEVADAMNNLSTQVSSLNEQIRILQGQGVDVSQLREISQQLDGVNQAVVNIHENSQVPTPEVFEQQTPTAEEIEDGGASQEQSEQTADSTGADASGATLDSSNSSPEPGTVNQDVFNNQNDVQNIADSATENAGDNADAVLNGDEKVGEAIGEARTEVDGDELSEDDNAGDKRRW